MNSASIRLAQRLVAGALSAASSDPDGVFSEGFIANITRFQSLHSLPSTRKVDAATWRALATISVASPSSSPVVISALQDALTSLGFVVKVDGSWGNDTSAAFTSFRSTRSLPPPSSPPSTTPTDWLLLSSWCVPSSGSFWFDAGWPQGVMDVLTLACLRYSGFEFATFECWRGREGPEQANGWWPECVENVRNARAAGFSKVSEIYNWDSVSPKRAAAAPPPALRTRPTGRRLHVARTER
jgi:peptidoglycan hydrolase-like protein with peptidoglycan-binding domain